jgi:hypothetical protein
MTALSPGSNARNDMELTADIQQGVRPRIARARAVLFALAALLPVLLLVQVYLAGLFLMGGEDVRQAHIGLGRGLQFYPVLLLLVGLLAQMPRTFWLYFIVLWVAMIAQAWIPLLTAAGGSGLVRALHPLNGFFLFGMSVQLIRTIARVRRSQ